MNNVLWIVFLCSALTCDAQMITKGETLDTLTCGYCDYFVEPHPEEVLGAMNAYDVLDEIARAGANVFSRRIQPVVPVEGDFWFEHPDSFWVNPYGTLSWSGRAQWSQVGSYQLYEFEERLVLSTGEYRMLIMQTSRTETGIVWARHSEKNRADMSFALYENGIRTMTIGSAPSRQVLESFRNVLNPDSITAPE